jgi:hypothetical protein
MSFYRLLPSLTMLDHAFKKNAFALRDIKTLMDKGICNALGTIKF